MVGGLETSNNHRSGVVQIRDILQGPTFPTVCAQSFSPYVWRSGFHWLLAHFPSHPGRLTAEDLARAPKVILVGHSLGGWAVLSVARNLKRKGIPVELCVQIDSVGITDHTAPRNVKAAAIFHANDAMFLLTTKTIKLEDSGQTKLVESILVNDAGHWSVTRDPRVRDLVLCTVESLVSAPGHMSHCPSRPELSLEAPVTERPTAIRYPKIRGSTIEMEPIRAAIILRQRCDWASCVEARKNSILKPCAVLICVPGDNPRERSSCLQFRKSVSCKNRPHHSKKSRIPGTKRAAFSFLKNAPRGVTI
jgi:hypothetical protein